MPLRTRNIFIDTQAFVKAGLDFQSRVIKAFVDASGSGELNHIMTSISRSEIRDKITESIKDALNRVIDFRRKAKILEGSADPVILGLFAQYDPAHVHKLAQDVFQSFIDDSKAKILSLEKVNAEDVFSRYFSQEPPFQEGKKKHEFPDAFSLLAIKHHLNDREECYVVSEDSDLKAFCAANPQFILVEDLGKLLDVYNSHDAMRFAFVKDFIAHNVIPIKRSIEEQVDEAEFYNNSTWEDAEVISHTVRGIDDFEPDIIYIDDESCVVSFVVDVRSLVEVEGPDYVNGIYDRESGHVVTFDNTLREDEVEIEVKVEIELDFEVKDDEFVVQEMRVRLPEISRGIEVGIEEEEYIR
jgi:hypothetical protein